MAGPVLAPVLNSVTMILMALLLVGRQERGHFVKFSLTDWILIFGGALIILYTYLVDYTRLLIESGALASKDAPEAAERLIKMITSYIPESYMWLLYIVGEVLILASITNILFKSHKSARDEKAN